METTEAIQLAWLMLVCWAAWMVVMTLVISQAQWDTRAAIVRQGIRELPMIIRAGRGERSDAELLELERRILDLQDQIAELQVSIREGFNGIISPQVRALANEAARAVRDGR